MVRTSSRFLSRFLCAESYLSELFLNKFQMGYVVRNINALPTRRSAPGRSNCVILKLLYKVCVYARVLKILIKFLSYALSLLLLASPSSTRRSLILLVVLVVLCRSERMVPMIHPSERTVVSRSSRDQRDTRPRVTHVTLTRGISIISYPYSS